MEWNPEVTARHVALVCHPHPLYGGTMHNKVVFRAAKAALLSGLPTLRFNFRGAGKSVGTFTGATANGKMFAPRSTTWRRISRDCRFV